MPILDLTPSPFHKGELQVQKNLGVDEKSARIGKKLIRDYMPDQHRDFFEMLPYIFISAVDQDGHPWASYLAGPPGFIHSPNDKTLIIHAALPPNDSLVGQLDIGSKIGFLGIELPTRRRNRLNSRLITFEDGVLTCRVEQSFGNCPKYIYRQTLEFEKNESSEPTIHLKELNSALTDLIRNTTTFFIASRSQNLGCENHSGTDVSHRGGDAGFIHVLSPTELVFPDYKGNNLYNTLGNIQSDPRIGLLFLDAENNQTIQIKAEAEILWANQERSLFIEIEEIIINRNHQINMVEIID